MAGEPRSEQEVVARFQQASADAGRAGESGSRCWARPAAATAANRAAACHRLFACPCPQLLEERDQLTSAQIERQQDVAEHDLVIKTLEPLEAGRKCFRLVGEVLVERTVGEVLPAVKKNRDNLAAVRERVGAGARMSCCWVLPGCAAGAVP